MQRRRPKIGLFIETSRGYGRGVLSGVATYAQQHGPWSFYHQERSLADPDPPWLKDWRGDGILARFDSKPLVDRIMRCKLPVVGLTGAHAGINVRLVQSDERQVIRLAFDHLLERGFERLAFCGFPGAYYSDLRMELFRSLSDEHRVPSFVFTPPRRKPALTTPTAEEHGMHDSARLAQWLIELPKPIGLIACNDIRAQHVLNVCRDHELSVPDEIAVLGIDDDEFICQLCDPPLSSVQQDTFKIGYQAAQMLDALLQGELLSEQQVTVPPIGIAARLSTDVVAIDDREVATAMRFIRDHACDNIKVQDILSHVPLSRSTLERRFAASLGRSPKDEIDRARLAAIRRLLGETDYKLSHVAALTGFSHSEYMATFVKSLTGHTPRELRRKIYLGKYAPAPRAGRKP